MISFKKNLGYFKYIFCIFLRALFFAIFEGIKIPALVINNKHTTSKFDSKNKDYGSFIGKDSMNLERSYWRVLLVINHNMLVFSVMTPGVSK